MLKFIEATFQCIYVYLEPPKAGFLANCRSVKSLDKCFLGGLLGAHLVIAMGIDANDCIYLITCAWVSKENHDNWTWFLELLSRDFGINNIHHWTFISDYQNICVVKCNLLNIIT